MYRSVGVATLIALGLGGGARAGEARLEEELARLAAVAGGTTGVAAIHLESGRAAYLNPGQRFPMASSYKIAIALQLLHRVDAGEISLDTRVEVDGITPGSGMISHLLDDPGVSLSLHNLLELMLLISDNTATDMCLRAAGGPEAVTGRLRALGIEGVRVDRSTLELIADWAGLEEYPPPDERSSEVFEKLYEAVPEERRRAAAAAFDADPRDTATPFGMGRLLEAVWKGEGLSPGSRELLLDIMGRCETGAARLPGRLPEGTPVAHKTGTIGGTTNDVGILTLPGNAGHVAVAVLVRASERPVGERERAIAEIARAVHDYFLFTQRP